jgi:hypothetical protein
MDPTAPSQHALPEDSLSRRLDGLIRLYSLGTLVLTVFCGAMALFAFRECSVARIELQARLEQIRVARRDYSTREPLLRDFTARLKAFAATHPDFSRVLTNHTEVLSMFASPPTPGTGGSRSPSTR